MHEFANQSDCVFVMLLLTGRFITVRAYDDHVLEQLRLMQTSPYLPFSGTFLPHPAVYPTYSSGPAPHPTEMAYPYPYMSSVSSVQADNLHAAHTSTDRLVQCFFSLFALM